MPPRIADELRFVQEIQQVDRDKDFVVDLALVDSLLKKPSFNVNHVIVLDRGDTILVAACRRGHTAVVRKLLEHPRIDVNLPNDGQATPFYIACQEGHSEVVSLLLCDPRVEVNRTPNDKVTPLSIACDYCHSQVIAQLVLDPRIDVNLRDTEGISPLWSISHNGLIEVAQILLAGEKVVDTQAKPFPGEEPWMDTTAAEVGRQQPTLTPEDFDSDEEHIRSITFGPKIADLIDEYDKDPIRVKTELRRLPHVRGHISPPHTHTHTLTHSSQPLLPPSTSSCILRESTGKRRRRKKFCRKDHPSLFADVQRSTVVPGASTAHLKTIWRSPEDMFENKGCLNDF